jgi:thiol-disulfide isomerase/thioredoxin
MKYWKTIALAFAATATVGGVLTGCQKTEAPTETSTVATEPPPATSNADAPAAVQPTAASTPPTTLPEFSLANRAGEMQSIRSWPGKSLIVNFWATWCAPCRKEIPLLIETNKKEAANGFQVVGIAVDFRDDVLKYADEAKMDYPLLIGEQDGFAAAAAFGINSMGLPFTVFSDNQGRIVTTFIGEITPPKLDILINGVKEVNAGKATPDTARANIQMAMEKLPKNAH